MARAHKAIAFIVIALSFLQISFAQSSLSLAQRHPMAPKDNTDYYKTCILAYKAHIHIPLYLNDPRNASIKYNWYHTAELFGERTRTEELPYYSEEGTYVNGRLSTYKHSLSNSSKDIRIDKIIWSTDGKIKAVNRYYLDGSFERSFLFSDIEGLWYSHISLETEKGYKKYGHGRIDENNVFVTEIDRSSHHLGGVRLIGYQITDDNSLNSYDREVYMSSHEVYAVFTYADVPRGWHDNNHSYYRGYVYYGGNIGGYDPNDELSFDCYEY